jgi:hypothetical protein
MKESKLTLLLFLFVAFAFSPLKSSAAEGDTLIVPTEIDGEMNGAINKFIMADTTASGERNPNRVYKLERGKIYIQKGILDVDFNFRLVADDDDPNNPVRPPMIVPGYTDEGFYYSTDGDLWLQFMFGGDNQIVEMKNIILQNVGVDKLYSPAWCMQFVGENITAHYKDVVFNGYQGGVFLPVANGYKLYIEDCELRNNHAKTNPFMGQSIGSWPGFYADTISVVNTTFFNNTSYILLPNRSIVDYIRFEHNTIFTTIIQPVFAFWMTNVDFKNNIFFGTHAIAVSGEGYNGGWYSETEDNPPAIISLQPIDSTALADAGLTEADRKVVVENNAYFIPKRITDYWDESIAANDSFVVQKPVWINDRTQAMFDDNENYPNLTIANNIIDVDPGFDAALETMVLDSVFAFINGFNEHGWEWEGGIIGHYAPNGDIFNIPWPLPENLAYSNEQIKSGGIDGFPIGDLNWFPDKKDDWLTGLEENVNALAPSEYRLSQNYPNPFNPTTRINFSIPVSGKTTLTVYNVLGQKIATLVDANLAVGSYNYEFDASGLSSGIYFYKLQSENYSKIMKMMLIK